MAKFNVPNYTSADGLGFPLNFRRGNPNPLDNSSVWASLEAAQTYASTDPVAYVGQVLSVLDVVDGVANSATVYCIQDESGTLSRVGTVTLGDDTTIIKNEDNTLSIKGYAEAADGAQLVKTADGLSWVVPSTDTVEGLQTAVATLQATVGDSNGGLVKQVADNKAAIEVLNADSTTAGSVAYQIAQIVAGADESLDTLKEIADWISSHGTDAATMNSNISANTEAIAALETLVGDTAVATQIANAIDEALKAEGADKYALASDLTALAGRVGTNETDIAALKAKVGESTVADQINAALTVDGEDKYALKSHTHQIGDVTGLQNELNAKALATDLSSLETTVAGKADKATTLEGYGITDAYTKTEADTKIADAVKSATGGESAASVLAELNAYKTSNDAAVGANTTAITELQAADTTLQGNIDTVSGELSAHVQDTVVHITADERTQWNAAEANVLENVTSTTLTVSSVSDKSVSLDLQWLDFV